MVVDYPLALMWVCSNAANQQANYKLANSHLSCHIDTFMTLNRIHLQCPESELTLHCKDLKVKV